MGFNYIFLPATLVYLTTHGTALTGVKATDE